MPSLAAIELDKLLSQLLFVLFILWRLRSAFTKGAKEERPRRRRAPVPQGEEALRQEALQLELLEELERRQELQPPAPAPSELGEGEELSAPLGLDLSEVEEALPSRHEEQFESNLIGAEGVEPLPALRPRPAPSRRREHRSHVGSPAALRRAIITAELLGPPVALRGDSLSRPRS